MKLDSGGDMYLHNLFYYHYYLLNACKALSLQGIMWLAEMLGYKCIS